MYSRQNTQYPVPAPPPTLQKPETTALPSLAQAHDASAMNPIAPQQQAPPPQQQPPPLYGAPAPAPAVHSNLQPFAGTKNGRVYRCVCAPVPSADAD